MEKKSFRLDFTPLQNALRQLEKSLEYYHSPAAQKDEGLRDQFRAAAIQGFEFTFEICWKFIQRWLKVNRASVEAGDLRTRKELFRMAAHEKLIRDPLLWFEYSDARNLTSHTYSQPTAERVFQTVVRFLPDAKYLLQQLERGRE